MFSQDWNQSAVLGRGPLPHMAICLQTWPLSKQRLPTPVILNSLKSKKLFSSHTGESGTNEEGRPGGRPFLHELELQWFLTSAAASHHHLCHRDDACAFGRAGLRVCRPATLRARHADLRLFRCAALPRLLETCRIPRKTRSRR